MQPERGNEIIQIEKFNEMIINVGMKVCYCFYKYNNNYYTEKAFLLYYSPHHQTFYTL